MKDDVNNSTLLLKRRSMTFCMCVGLHDPNQHCIEHLDCRNGILSFCAKLCQTKTFQSVYSDVFHSTIVFSVTSQQSNLLRNVG